MTGPLLIAVLVLATFRATWLVTRDEFPLVKYPREAIVRRTYETRWEWFGDLVSCHWCASGWLALGIVFATTVFHAVPLPWLTWGAVWAGAAIIADVIADRKEG